MWIHCATHHWQMKSVNLNALHMLEVTATDRTIPALVGYFDPDHYAVIYEGTREACTDLHQSILSYHQTQGRVFYVSEWLLAWEAE